ncbi:hypothetical protein [Hydrogenimonas sp.]
MIDEGILAKESRMVALYGVNAQASPYLKILNATFKACGLNDFAIGLNIKPEDFAYMVKGMPSSKVTMALYEVEYEAEAANLVDHGDGCVARSGLCDGARAVDGKLYGECFYPDAFETMCACEGVSLAGKRILLLGATGVAAAIFPLFGLLGARSVTVADEVVERCAALLEANPTPGMATDIDRFTPGMAVKAEDFDIVVNAVDLYVHAQKRLIRLEGEVSGPLWLVDFVRGESAFDTLAKESGARRLGGEAFMKAKALMVAKKWLGAAVDCDVYSR